MLPNSPAESDQHTRKLVLFISISLCLLIFALYWQTLGHEFVFDDKWYILENPTVSHGLSLKGLRWAFLLSDKESTYYHPLAWLSHMMDVEAYGLKPAGHHLTNIILQCLNTLLLFLILARFTKNIAASTIVALLFAIHPLNIETVAWVAERKNLLSTFFAFCTILAYGHYVRKTNPGRYLVVLLLFLLALLAKPALTILPAILLLMDFWPLGRIHPDKFVATRFIKLVVEKIPLLVLSVGSVLVASASLRMYGNMVPFSKIPLSLRLANGLVSSVKYIWRMMAPFGQSILYPFPRDVPAVYWIGSLFFLVLVSLFCLKSLKKKPYYFVGWFWFLAGLLPVSGLLQNGLWPALADRYVYFPAIGIFIIVGWTGTNYYHSAGMKGRKWLSAIGVVVALFFVVVTYNQIKTWKNPLTVFQQAVIHAPENYVVNLDYANALFENGQVEDAIRYYSKAILLEPASSKAHRDLAVALIKQNKYAQAIPHLKKAIELSQDSDPVISGKIHFVLGDAYEKLKDLDNASNEYVKAIQLNPGFFEAYNALGIVLAEQGKPEEAISIFKKALKLHPDDQVLRQNLGHAMKLLLHKD